MIILNKKRILLMTTLIAISIFAFTIQTAQINETVQTVALPVSNKTIVIDAGHGKPDEGAESSTRNNRGRNQFENSIKIAKFIRTIRSNSYFNKK